MGVMAVGLFITIFLLFHRISQSCSRDEGSSSSYTHQFVYPINLRSKTQQELVEAAKELNETREKNAEVERKLRSESMELKAELATKITELRAQIQSERENKTAEIAKLQADLNRTTTFLGLDGWLYLEETASWYKVINQRMTFDEAEEYCASRKSHLVSIHSQEENDFVQELAKAVHSCAGFWIGMKKNPNKENAFEWSDGSSVDFTNWKVGEPDSNTHAVFHSADRKWVAWRPNDTNQYRFICKRSSQF